MNIEIANHTGGGIKQKWMEGKLREAVRLLGIRKCQWTLTLVGDSEMSKLHHKTMNIRCTTDVLTFDLRDAIPKRPREGDPVELDTVLCRDEAMRRSKEFYHGLNAELLLYALHSLLHVQGHDDITPHQSARMHALEDEILTRLGIGPLYHGRGAIA